MKQKLIRLAAHAAVLCPLLFSLAYHAMSQDLPPAPVLLSDEVNKSDHIFIGVAKSLVVIDSHGDEVKPEPEALNTNIKNGVEAQGQAVELRVTVEQALYPSSPRPEPVRKVVFGEGKFGVKGLRRALLGHRLIYMTNIVAHGANTPFFISSYGWNLTKNLNQMPNIKQCIKQRVKTEKRESAKPLTGAP